MINKMEFRFTGKKNIKTKGNLAEISIFGLNIYKNKVDQDFLDEYDHCDSCNKKLRLNQNIIDWFEQDSDGYQERQGSYCLACAKKLYGKDVVEGLEEDKK